MLRSGFDVPTACAKGHVDESSERDLMTGTKDGTARAGVRPYQIATVFFCMFLNMLDGYDVLVMGFAMPHLPEGFATNPQKGYLISAALAGMAVGAIGLARFADVIGRRRVLLAGLAANTAGLAASALSTGFETLLVTRFVTGIAIGTISVVIIVLCQEAVPPNRRSVALGLVMIGYPLGTMLAGFAGAGLVSVAGGAWQGMFWIGSALGVLSFVVTAAVLRESEGFLARQGPEGQSGPAGAAPDRATRVLVRGRRSATTSLRSCCLRVVRSTI